MALTTAPEMNELVKQSIAFCRELLAKADPVGGLPADKAFIDALYEDDCEPV